MDGNGHSSATAGFLTSEYAESLFNSVSFIPEPAFWESFVFAETDSSGGAA